jgi:hypothetical protein
MQSSVSLPDKEAASDRGYLVCFLFFVLLVAWQAWMTLGLFGSYPWPQLVDEEPIVSGTHPAHLYLGFLGAQAQLSSGSCCCYDPAFQAAYPRTPIFNGSRLAEIFLLLGGGSYQPAAYKIGLAVVSLLVPFFLFLAARTAGLSGAAGTLAAALGMLVWWGGPAQAAFKAGEVEPLLAALALLVHCGLLVRFHVAPGVGCWLGLLLSAALTWFAQPFLLPLCVPLLLVYYLSVGVKHRSLTWHLALLGSQVGGVAVNLFWLLDWLAFWWLRAPLPRPTSLLPHRTLGTLWNAPLWGGEMDRAVAMLLLGSAFAGICILNQSNQRPAARLLGLGSFGLVILALLGISWEPLGELGTAALLVPGLWFAAVPAAHAWTLSQQQLFGYLGAVRVLLLWACLGGVLAAIAMGQELDFDQLRPFIEAEPFTIGLNAEQQTLVETLIRRTGPEARILWEGRPLRRQAPHWSALLPLLTGRAFIGGLDSEATIQHMALGLNNQKLNGRHISSWRDVVLEDYCRRYNIGWVVCWSPQTIEHFRKWLGPSAEASALNDDGVGCLFTVRGHVPSYCLKGRAEILHADSHHITLGDVVPENGVVVLSLHYQRGFRAVPSRIQIEREADAHDPIGFIRLRVDGPVARVTLTWDDR